MSYSITRGNAARDLEALKAILDNDGIVEGDVKVLEEIADAIEAQLPKPVPAEPTGDVAVFRSGWFYKPGGNKGWVRDDLKPFDWDEITHGSPDDLAIYRRVGTEYDHTRQQVRDLLFRSPSGVLTPDVIADAYKALRKGLSGILADTPQSDATGTLPTSPSPEVGVATSPPVASLDIEEPNAWGSVVLASSDACHNRVPWFRDHTFWRASLDGHCSGWSHLHDPEVIRVGVGTEQANLDESVAYSNGYEKGAGDKAAAWRHGCYHGSNATRNRIHDIVEALKPSLITAPEKNAIDKALAAIKADVENTVTGPGFPS